MRREERGLEDCRWSQTFIPPRARVELLEATPHYKRTRGDREGAWIWLTLGRLMPGRQALPHNVAIAMQALVQPFPHRCGLRTFARSGVQPWSWGFETAKMMGNKGARCIHISSSGPYF